VDEQEDACASHHWTLGDDHARADVKGQHACQHASVLYQGAEAFGGWEVVKGYAEIHAQVAAKATRDRKDGIQKHNDKTYMRLPNFQMGDYVLVAKHRKSGTSKMKVKLKDPRRIASMGSDIVYVVENLLTKDTKAAHITRLRFYQDKELKITAELA
jgi:hypothetical protein